MAYLHWRQAQLDSSRVIAELCLTRSQSESGSVNGLLADATLLPHENRPGVRPGLLGVTEDVITRDPLS